MQQATRRWVSFTRELKGVLTPQHACLYIEKLRSSVQILGRSDLELETELQGLSLGGRREGGCIATRFHSVQPRANIDQSSQIDITYCTYCSGEGVTEPDVESCRGKPNS